MSNYTQRPVNTSDISLYNHVHPVQNSFGLNNAPNQFEIFHTQSSFACLVGHNPGVASNSSNSCAEVQSSGSDWYADSAGGDDGALYLKQTDIGATNSSWSISMNGTICNNGGSTHDLGVKVVKHSGDDYAYIIHEDTSTVSSNNYGTMDNVGTLCNSINCMKFGLNTDCFIFCYTNSHITASLG